MSWRIWVVSCSAAAVGGMAIGGIYEAVVSYDGPNAVVSAAAATLPMPTESAARRPAGQRPESTVAATGSTTVSLAGSPAADHPARGKGHRATAKAKPADSQSDKPADRPKAPKKPRSKRK